MKRHYTILVTSAELRWNSTGTCVAGWVDGTPGPAAHQLHHPYAILLDSNMSLFIVDSENHRIQKWSSGATVGVTVAGLANGTSGSSSFALGNPVGMAMDSARNLYFTDRDNHRVMYWAKGASSGTTIAGTTGEIDLWSVALSIKFILHLQVFQVAQMINSIHRPRSYEFQALVLSTSLTHTIIASCSISRMHRPARSWRVATEQETASHN